MQQLYLKQFFGVTDGDFCQLRCVCLAVFREGIVLQRRPLVVMETKQSRNNEQQSAG